jgi:hypothetical protein
MILLRYLLILLIPVLGYIGLRKLAIKYSLSQRQFNLLLVLASILAVIVVLILLGRLSPTFIIAPIMVAATFALRNLHLLIRLLPLWQMLRSRTAKSAYGSAGASDTSSIRTRFLLMQLQHATGDMDGEVLQGSFSGRRLSSLSMEQLLVLAQECLQDADSLQILEAYMDRVHPDWRADQASSSQQAHAPQPPATEAAMSETEALEILGLQKGATRDDVVQAHRRLMQKMHPDRGGSDYLARKINLARDYLLERL